MLLYRIPWFVSLSLVHCPQMAEDIDMITLAYDSRMLQIWLTSVNPFLPKFYPKVTHPLLI